MNNTQEHKIQKMMLNKAGFATFGFKPLVLSHENKQNTNQKLLLEKVKNVISKLKNHTHLNKFLKRRKGARLRLYEGFISFSSNVAQAMRSPS